MRPGILREMLKRCARTAVALPVLLLQAGCGTGEVEDLKMFVAQSGEGMRGKIMMETPPDVRPAPRMQFAGTGALAQPFDPARLNAPVRAGKPTGGSSEQPGRKGR